MVDKGLEREINVTRVWKHIRVFSYQLLVMNLLLKVAVCPAYLQVCREIVVLLRKYHVA